MNIAPESEASVPQSEGRFTAEKLAANHGVSRATVERAGQFAAAVDKLGLGEEVAAGQVGASRKEIIKAATALPENPTPEGGISQTFHAGARARLEIMSWLMSS